MLTNVPHIRIVDVKIKIIAGIQKVLANVDARKVIFLSRERAALV